MRWIAIALALAILLEVVMPRFSAPPVKPPAWLKRVSPKERADYLRGLPKPAGGLSGTVSGTARGRTPAGEIRAGPGIPSGTLPVLALRPANPAAPYRRLDYNQPQTNLPPLVTVEPPATSRYPGIPGSPAFRPPRRPAASAGGPAFRVPGFTYPETVPAGIPPGGYIDPARGVYQGPDGIEYPLDENGQPTIPDILLPRGEAAKEYNLLAAPGQMALSLMRGMLPSTDYKNPASSYSGFRRRGGGGGGYDPFQRYLDNMNLVDWTIG